MTGSNASNFTPLSVGVADSGDFSSYLGKPIQVGDETYVMVQASAAIASGSNGKQVQTAISAGVGSYVVTLSTGAEALVCGAIPSSLTGPIAASAYFLALRESASHVLQVGGATTGAIVAYEPLKTTTGATLVNVFTGSMLTTLTGVSSTSSGMGVTLYSLIHSPSVALEALTGTAAVSGSVAYHAPFRQ